MLRCTFFPHFNSFKTGVHLMWRHVLISLALFILSWGIENSDAKKKKKKKKIVMHLIIHCIVIQWKTVKPPCTQGLSSSVQPWPSSTHGFLHQQCPYFGSRICAISNPKETFPWNFSTLTDAWGADLAIVDVNEPARGGHSPSLG